MLIVKLIFRPYGCANLDRDIGELQIVNDGTGDHERGNYRLRLTGDRERAKVGEVWQFPRERLKAWDLVKVALENLLGHRSPSHAYAGDELYIKRGGKYQKVCQFEGFPASGVVLVEKGDDAETWRCSYRWIGDLPAEDALTYAAAQRHHQQASKALSDLKESTRRDSLKVICSDVPLEEVRRAREALEALMQGRPIEDLAEILDIVIRVKEGEVYQWQQPSISDMVDAVLNAIAQGETEAARSGSAS